MKILWQGLGLPTPRWNRAGARVVTVASVAAIALMALLIPSEAASRSGAQTVRPAAAQLVRGLRSHQLTPVAPRVGAPASAYAKLPLSFVPNVGQADPRVRFAAQSGGTSTFFTRRQAVFVFAKNRHKAVALRLGFPGASRQATIGGESLLAGRINYLIGNDRSKWRRNVRTYGTVVYRNLWPGTDLRFEGGKGRLKYELVLAPGARVSQVRLAYRGARSLSLDRSGNLAIHTALGTLKDTRPSSYQVRNGKRVRIPSRFVLGQGASYGFALGTYDRRQPLVIDPGLVYSTYLGGPGDDTGDAIAVDPRGNAYVTGDTYSPVGFPTTAGAFQPSWQGAEDAFVTKLNPSGSALVYSTYLGGTADEPYWSGSIAVDPSGQAYVAGTTLSPDFPTTSGAFQQTYQGGIGDAYVTKLNRNGSGLVYSTFLGSPGDDGAYYSDAIALDGCGSAYVTGFTDSAGFPTKNAYQSMFKGVNDAFVSKLNPSGSSLVYSTYLGGSNDDDATGIAVSGGNAYVSGYTASTDFPTRHAYQSTNGGAYDGFVTRLDDDGDSLDYSTYLGRTGFDVAGAIDVGGDGKAVVTGDTDGADFPTTPGAFQQTYGGGADDEFVTKLSSSGSSLAYSTFLGGSGNDYANNVAVDWFGQAHVVGFSDSSDFPVTPNAVQPIFGGAGPPWFYGDATVAKLSSSGSSLAYSSYLGGTLDETGLGVALDWAGKVYLTGSTNSLDFPTTPGAWDRTYNGSSLGYGYGDAWVAKLDVGARHGGICDHNDDSDKAERDELARINSERSASFLPPLTLNTTSSNVARQHGCDEREHGDVREQGSDGSMAPDRLRSAGLLFTLGAENDAVGQGATGSDASLAAQQELASDPVANANMLNPAFRQVGIGAVYLDGVLFLTEDYTG